MILLTAPRTTAAFNTMIAASKHAPLVIFALVDDNSVLVNSPELRHRLTAGWCTVTTSSRIDHTLAELVGPMSVPLGYGPHHLGLSLTDAHPDVRLALLTLFSSAGVGPRHHAAAAALARHASAFGKTFVAETHCTYGAVWRARATALVARAVVLQALTLEQACVQFGVAERTARTWLRALHLDPCALRARHGPALLHRALRTVRGGRN